MYLMHVDFAVSFDAIGRIFGRDRTTVSHACRVVEDGRDDIWLDCRLAAIELACRQGRRTGAAPAGPEMRAGARRRKPASARHEHGLAADVDPHRAQHLALAARRIETDAGAMRLLVNESESPLAWLARRKGRDGRAMIGPHQFLAGERLRGDFTRAQLTPRVTSRWEASTGSGGGRAGPAEMTDLIVGARQRVRHALEACGPEFAGVLMDVCCFLRGLEDVERERGWPPRSAKVVLQLGLDRLARQYGLRTEVRGAASARIRTWLAEGAAFDVE